MTESLIVPIAVELVLVAVLVAYGRRVLGEAERRHGLALERMSELSEANELLVSLHRVAQSLPASLHLDQVLESTETRLRSLVDCDVVSVLVLDESTQRWHVGAGEGAGTWSPMEAGDLPAPIRGAMSGAVASLVVSLGPGESFGPSNLARSGLYAPLRARDSLLGMLVLEHHEPGHFGRRELRLLDGFVEPAALAIDNAHWFARLRAMGADEERTRIARDVHDRVGQSLAYVAFELDRMVARASGEHAGELKALRQEVRGALGEVRDTLCDLRTDVSDGQGLVETLTAFLDRIRARTDLEVDFRHHARGRLPLAQEREMWRVAQEAITNVEHHAGARHLRVRWQCDGSNALLTVADDGRGFSVDDGRRDSYGLTGMHERADAVGARLVVESELHVGTLIECSIGASVEEDEREGAAAPRVQPTSARVA